jgi:hypothetical protein
MCSAVYRCRCGFESSAAPAFHRHLTAFQGERHVFFLLSLPHTRSSAQHTALHDVITRSLYKSAPMHQSQHPARPFMHRMQSQCTLSASSYCLFVGRSRDHYMLTLETSSSMEEDSLRQPARPINAAGTSPTSSSLAASPSPPQQTYLSGLSGRISAAIWSSADAGACCADKLIRYRSESKLVLATCLQTMN